MPLLTTRDFPGINAVPDESGLARGIFTALQGVQQRKAQQEELKRLETAKQLDIAGAQAMQIRNMATDSTDPSQRRMDNLRQRKTLTSIMMERHKQGLDNTLFEEAFDEKDPDMFNTKLMNLVAKTEQGRDLIFDQAKQRSGIGNTANFRMGESRFAKDSKGNLYQLSAAFDPKNAATHGLITPMEGSPEKPEGQLQIISRSGMTPQEKMQTAVQTAEGVESVKTEEIIKREEGKSGVKLEWEPRIAEAVELAKTSAKDKGEVLNELDQMEAALPLLQESVSELRELAEVATYTTGGRMFDLLVKETGFGATEGATSRAKFIAIINNQVLPLLRPTFGAAFTVQEGESLKATMGDPDATPEEKLAQLDAFIAQKERDIRAKGRQHQPKTNELTPEQQKRLDELRKAQGQ